MIILSPLLQAESKKEDDSPTLELLEFLGEWENSDGQWIDPEEFEDDDFAKLLILTDEESVLANKREAKETYPVSKRGFEKDE